MLKSIKKYFQPENRPETWKPGLSILRYFLTGTGPAGNCHSGGGECFGRREGSTLNSRSAGVNDMLNFEIIDATKILSIARSLATYRAPFSVLGGYRLIDNGIDPEATVQIEADGRLIHEASTGNGPVDALAKVLKKALIPLFPEVETVALIDYRANILDAKRGTSTDVEVTILFTDGEAVWKVNALSENINAASFQVLLDGFEYAILKKRPRQG